MPRIIKNRDVIEDLWTLLPAQAGLQDALECEHPIVPVALWQQYATELRNLRHLGIWLDSNELIEDLAEDLDAFELVALNFPVFTDGRHFSSARLLRERYGYDSEVRAIGDVLRDQLLMMKRCGFDAFAVRSDRDPYDALQALDEFSVQYQGAWDNPLPLFRRRHAAEAKMPAAV